MQDASAAAATPVGEHRTRRERAALVGFIAGCAAVYAISGALTAVSVGGWYQGLAKPAFNPPDWLFAPVWGVLYAMMAVAVWRVWRLREHPGRSAALGLFAVQLLLNVGWSAVFFGLQAVGAALVEIVVLWLAIAATTAAFIRVDRGAGLMLVPYLLWVSFAAVLNAAIWRLN